MNIVCLFTEWLDRVVEICLNQVASVLSQSHLLNNLNFSEIQEDVINLLFSSLHCSQKYFYVVNKNKNLY